MFSLVLFPSPAVVHIMNEVLQMNFDLMVFLMFALASFFGLHHCENFDFLVCLPTVYPQLLHPPNSGIRVIPFERSDVGVPYFFLVFCLSRRPCWKHVSA
jgi:hypothetical protein